MVTSIYQDGDPQLQAFSSMLQAEDPADLTWTQEGQSVMVGPRDPRLRRAAGRRGAARGPPGPARRRRGRGRGAPRGGRRPPPRDEGPHRAGPRPRGRACARSSTGAPDGQGERGAGQGAATAPSCASCARRSSGSSELIARQAARTSTPAYQLGGAASSAEPDAGRLRHVAVRLPHAPDLRLLRPPQRHRLRRRLRPAAAGGVPPADG